MADSNKGECWNITVRQYFEQLVSSEVRRLDSSLAAHAKEDVLRHELEQRAVDLARENVEKRLLGMNQIREQLNEERGRYVQRESYDAQHSALREELLKNHEGVSSRVSILENKSSNLDGRFWALGTILTGVVIVVNLALKYWK